MAQPRFDPSQTVKFDLTRGQVSFGGSDARVLVPTDALHDLCRGAGNEAMRDFGRRLGTEAGRRAAARLIDGPANASMTDVIEHLGGDLALLGLGSLAAERWGRALVLTVTHSPLGSQGDELLAAVLEGAIQRAMARDVAVVPLHRDDALARLLVVSPSAATRVRAWIDGGTSWGDVLAKLNGSGDA